MTTYDTLISLVVFIILLAIYPLFRQFNIILSAFGFLLIAIANLQKVEVIKYTAYILIALSIILYARDLKIMKKRSQSIRDALTGVYSRYFIEEYLEEELRKAKRFDKKFTLLFIDLNDFKLVNDRYGHYVGDWVLKEMASKILSNLRDYDLLARWGGDEFLALLPEVACIEVLEILDRLYNNAFLVYKDLKVTLSVGYACYPDNGSTIEQLVKEADNSMYRAKSLHKEVKRSIS